MTLRGLLYFTATLSCALAGFGAWGVAAFAALMLALAVLKNLSKDQIQPPTFSESLFISAIVGIALILFAAPGISTPRSVVRHNQSLNNLKQLLLGIHTYHDVHKCFPEPQTVDPNGTKRHSWRTLILPHIEHPQLHAAIRLDAQWNSASQVVAPFTQLKDYEIHAFASPRFPGKSLSHETSYFAIVDSDSLWPPGGGISFRDVPDGASRTIALIEAAGRGVPWAEPRDLSMDEAIDLLVTGSVGPPTEFLVDRTWYTSVRRVGDGLAGRCIAMADGSARSIGRFKDRATARAYLTRAGGEDVPDIDECVTSRRSASCYGETVVHWNRVVATAGFVGLAVVPAFKRPRQWLFG